MNDPRSGPGGRACEDMRLLIQADLDGELDAAATAVLTAHVAECPGCLEEQQELSRLSALLRAEAPRHAAPAALREHMEAQLLPRRATPPPPSGFRRLRPLLPFGAGAAIAGAALAASLMLVLLPPSPRGAADEEVEAQLVISHIRALQPGHLTDVLSTDKHTVKPWFNGRIDYAPPVRDFAQQGFPLIGGRLDYVGGRAVAVLVYAHGGHKIDVYVWPDRDAKRETPEVKQGYNLVYWTDHGMQCVAVSDLEPGLLAAFVRLWTTAAA